MSLLNSNSQLADNQLAAFEHLQKVNFCGIIWHKPGEGKSRTALHCALQCRPMPLKVIIVCPKNAILSWQDEIVKYNFWLPHEIYSADSFYKLKVEQDFSRCFLIVDELYYFANPNAHRSKMLKKRSQFFPHRIGLSGTIMPTSDNMTIWGQLSAMNMEFALCKTASRFRDLYQESIFSPFGGKKFKNKKGATEAIIKKLEPYVHVHFPENDNRKIKESILDISLTGDQIRAVNNLRDNYLHQLQSGEILDYKLATEIYFNVCKVTNGWYEDDKKQIVETYLNRKLERLLGILEPLVDSEQQAVVWCSFRNDLVYLAEKLPWKTLKFWGGEDFNVKAWNTGKYPVVLATCSSGASVNYFGNVQYGIYYSLPNKLKDFEQSKGRHERKSSQHEGAYYYYLCSKEPSFDSRIFSRLKINQTNETEVIQGFVKEFLDIHQ